MADDLKPPQEPEVSKGDWRAELARVGEQRGFYEEIGAEHTSLFVRGEGAGSTTLIVTFENLDHVFEGADDRMPWGYDFVTSRGWSMLGMMAHGWTWYRDEHVFDFFDRLQAKGFFEQFDNVVFYGASMGAYAASVFCAAAPGSTAILLSPQATLSRDVAPWETRYRKAWARSYSGRYAYGPDQVKNANRVHLFYDPREPLDAMHAALFRGHNITKYHCRFMGHRIASLWMRMGVLKQVVMGCVDGTMNRQMFYKLMRARLLTVRYQQEMLRRLQKLGRPWLIANYTRAVLNNRRGPKFRRALAKAEAQLTAQKRGK